MPSGGATIIPFAAAKPFRSDASGGAGDRAPRLSLFDQMRAAQHGGCSTCGRIDAEGCPWMSCPNKERAFG